jgi:hypothetical protein
MRKSSKKFAGVSGVIIEKQKYFRKQPKNNKRLYKLP